MFTLYSLVLERKEYIITEEAQLTTNNNNLNLNQITSDRWFLSRMNRYMDARTDKWMDGWMGGRTDGWLFGWMDELTNGWLVELCRWVE